MFLGSLLFHNFVPLNLKLRALTKRLHLQLHTTTFVPSDVLLSYIVGAN